MQNSNPSNSIRNWSEDERPREKLATKGPMSLSDSELVAILINSGSRDKSAIALAKEILALGSNNLAELGKLSIIDLQKIKGIGAAKAIMIAACLELGRRREGVAALDKPVIRSSSDIADFLVSKLKDLNHEVFAVVFLNRANKINHFKIISSGGITGTVADPRIILKIALEYGAVSMVLSHNHPSGNLKPSQADQDLTLKIKEASKYFDIRVMDHIIVSDEGYFSFADEGLL